MPEEEEEERGAPAMAPPPGVWVRPDRDQAPGNRPLLRAYLRFDPPPPQPGQSGQQPADVQQQPQPSGTQHDAAQLPRAGLLQPGIGIVPNPDDALPDQVQDVAAWVNSVAQRTREMIEESRILRMELHQVRMVLWAVMCESNADRLSRGAPPIENRREGQQWILDFLRMMDAESESE
jgi:hypothetical protein